MEKLTPKDTIKAICINCLCMKQFNVEQVTNCEGNYINCNFFLYRLGKRPPIAVFRKYCIQDCMNGYKDYVAECTTKDCANYPYRFGKNPDRQGIGGKGNINNLRQAARE